MITFDHDQKRFNYRTVAVILHNDQVLLHRAETDPFWSLPGGRVELLEPAGVALRREVQEELGLDCRVERLLWVVENFFEYADKACHELALYFLISLENGNELYAQAQPFEGREGHVRLIFKWHPLASLGEILLYPSFLKEALLLLPEAPQYIVHRDE